MSFHSLLATMDIQMGIHGASSRAASKHIMDCS